MPSGGRAQPDRNWAWTTPRRKPRRTLVAQPTVRSDLVVFLPEVAHHHPCFRQCPQLFPVQAFVPEPAVKAFHKTVLPRAAWLNVDRLDPMLLQPPLHDLRNELRAVVTPQIRRCCMRRKQKSMSSQAASGNDSSNLTFSATGRLMAKLQVGPYNKMLVRLKHLPFRVPLIS